MISTNMTGHKQLLKEVKGYKTFYKQSNSDNRDVIQNWIALQLKIISEWKQRQSCVRKCSTRLKRSGEQDGRERERDDRKQGERIRGSEGGRECLDALTHSRSQLVSRVICLNFS